MDTDQHEMYEYARKRIRQKKRLYFHFVLFFIGSLFLFVANKWLEADNPTDWYMWVIAVWAFVFILHFIQVFITDSFMNKKWERAQIDKLLMQQQKKIAQLQNDLEKQKT